MTLDHHRIPTGSSLLGTRVRAAAAALGMVAIVVGVPMALVPLGMALPIEVTALRPGALLRPDDGSVLLVALLALAWTSWAVTAVSVSLEVVATLRRMPTPDLPGARAPQRLAAILVAAVVVGLSTVPVGASAVTAAPESASDGLGVTGRAPWSVLATSAEPSSTQMLASRTSLGSEEVAAAPHSPGQDRDRAVSSGSPRGRSEERDATGRRPQRLDGASVTVARHDTLWALAERHLGSGERFTEIVDLNLGVTQDDGRALGHDGRIYPGWVLALPGTGAAAVGEPHHVRRGETLWSIAEDSYGQGARFRELFVANRGLAQADGRRLTDPDLIIPGWELAVPDLGLSGPDPEASSAGGGPLPSPSTPESGAGDVPALDRAQGGTERGEGATAEALPLERGPVSDGAVDGMTAVDGPAVGASSGRLGSASGGEAPALIGAPTPELTAGPESPPAQSSTRAPTPSVAPTPASTSTAGAGPHAVLEPAAEAGPVSAAGPAHTVRLPGAGVLATVVLAGVAGEVARRRRVFQRYRRPGERMPQPEGSGLAAEAAAREGLADPAVVHLRRALSALSQVSSSRPGPQPRPRLVRLTSESVIIEFDSATADPVGPFTALDAETWQFDLAAPVEDLGELHSFPGLVTLGVAGSEVVLLNLEAVGMLALTGPGEVTGPALQALVADVAMTGVAGLTEPLICLADPRLADSMEPGRVEVEEDPTRAASAMRTRMAASRTRRRGAPPDPVDPLQVVVADVALGVAPPPGCGVVLITSAEQAGAGATLALQRDGRGVLHPDGVPLATPGLPPAAVEAVVSVLAATELPDEATEYPGHPEIPEAHTHEPEFVVDLREGSRPARSDPALASLTVPGAGPAVSLPTTGVEHAVASATHGRGASMSVTSVGLALASREDPTAEPAPAAAPAPEPADASAPRVLVLGEIRVENAHGRAESTRIGRLAETAAFVLLNPGARPSELQGALWPGQRSNPATCRQMISRTRTWLGRGEDGQSYLLPFSETEGRLRLRQEVGSDWLDFQRLAALGLEDPDDLDHLTEALALVRGRPFGSVAARELPWADLAVNEMLCLITDVAHELAVRHERAGRWAAARDAALRGLRTECESEVLQAIVARTGRY